MNDLDDYEEDPYDYCYECGGYGDDYYMDEDGELVCRCHECPMNPNSWADKYISSKFLWVITKIISKTKKYYS